MINKQHRSVGTTLTGFLEVSRAASVDTRSHPWNRLLEEQNDVDWVVKMS